MYRDGIGRLPAFIKVPGTRLLAAVLTFVFAAYILWKIGQSPDQALQFAFNGLAVGAVYALLAMGFTIVYSTVWFFDLYYGAAAALGAYGVFYLSSQDTLQGRYEVDNLYISIVFGAVDRGCRGVGPARGPFSTTAKALELQVPAGRRRSARGERGDLHRFSAGLSGHP